MNQGLPEIKIKMPFADLRTSFVSDLQAHLHLGYFQMFFLI